MRPVLFNEEALLELEEMLVSFVGISDQLAERFERQISESVKLIALNPGIFHAGRYGVSRVNLADGFQRYYLAYIERPGQIFVVAVGVAERRPYYFKNRLKPSGS